MYALHLSEIKSIIIFLIIIILFTRYVKLCKKKFVLFLNRNESFEKLKN